MDQHGPNKNTINLNANWNCINNPNQHGCYNKPSIELVQKTSLVPTPIDLAICFQPSASMDPIVGYLFTWYYTQHSKQNRSGNSFSHENREYFFHQTRKQPKKNYEIQFQLEDYTSYFSTAHMNPHRPEGQNFVPTIWAPQWKRVVALDTSAIYSAVKPTWRCSQNQVLVCWCYKDRQAVGVENNGYIYIYIIYIMWGCSLPLARMPVTTMIVTWFICWGICY